MLNLLREIEGIETVGAMREALSEFPDDKRIGDAFGEPLRLEVLKNMDTGEEEISAW